MFNLRQVHIIRIPAAVAVSLALVFAAGCSRDPNVRKQKYLESGKRYEASGKYREAAIQFQNALKVDNDFAPAHYEMAKTLLKMNSVLPAYGELMKTVDLDPLNLPARIDLGNLLLAGRAPDRAEVQAKSVLAIDANNAQAYALLSGVEQYKGDNADALKDIQHAIAINPNRASYHTALALYEGADPANLANVEQELNKAASLDPKSASPHILLGRLLDKRGDVTGAQQQYLQAIGADPKNLEARETLAGLYLRGGDKAKAEQTLRQAVEDNPDDEATAGTLSEFYIRTGQLDQAENTFADLSSKHPKSTAIKITYARVLYEKKDYAKSAQIAAQLTKSNGGDPEVQFLNALLLLNSGKTDDAFILLKQAAKDNAGNIQIQLLLARVAASKQDIATAQSSLEAAARLDPGNLEAATGLAEIAIGRNDNGMLAELAEKTIQRHPDFANGYIWQGMTEVVNKEFDKAETDFQTALKKSPNDAVALFELGRLRLSLGHMPEGEALLQKALDNDPNSVRALGMLVACDLQAKQPAKAIARVQAQIAKSPQNASFYVQLAALQYATKDLQGSLASSQKAMQLSPGSSDAVEAYTQAEVALGNTDAAISAWQTLIAAQPNNPHAPLVLGTLEETKGDSAKAEDLYKKALQVDTNDDRDHAVAANNLAYLMVENNQNVDVALTLAQTARRIFQNDPRTQDNPMAADTLAWVYYYKGDYGAARDLLEGAVKTTPNDAQMQYHLGMVYIKLNDKTDAQLHLKKAASLAPDSKPGKDANAQLSKLG